jgi:predicted DCC family thiol-disulfide oxidoreductase YuxK
VNVNVQPPVLLFDGDCGFCTTCANWMRHHIRRLDTTIPYQRADLDALGVTAAQCEQALQWVAADGAVHSGELAVAHVLIDAGKGWAVIGRAIRLPGIRQISGVGYRWIARNRQRLPGGTPACSLDPSRTHDAR